MYNHEIGLVKTILTEDEYGNETEQEEITKILCKVADIGQQEFYNASVTDLRPELKFIIKSFEYNGEKKVVFDDQKYKVIRTYTVGKEEEGYKNRLRFDELELTCERVIGIG